MDKYRQALETTTALLYGFCFGVRPPKTEQGKALLVNDYAHLQRTLKVACEKAEKYDEVWDRLTKNHLTTDEEVEECNEYYIKQDAAKEIIEMIDAMCADENDFVIWKSGKYLPTKNIIQKIKESYGIK